MVWGQLEVDSLLPATNVSVQGSGEFREGKTKRREDKTCRLETIPPTSAERVLAVGSGTVLQLLLWPMGGEIREGNTLGEMIPHHGR